MSTATYHSSTQLQWNPETIYDLFEDRLLTTQLGINHQDRVVWWVTREETPVRWGDFASFNELVHHLYVVHVDLGNNFLYVNSSNNTSMHQDVAKAVGGEDAQLVSGETIYRILAKVSRRVPINVGLLDAISRTRRFSMHVGQDVLYAWSGEGGTKMKTNIFAHGFVEGRATSFGASRKGRIWSHEEARDIHDWVRWARQIGPAITDSSIELDSVMAGFLLPKPAAERPKAVPLSIEWPYELTATMSERRQVKFQSQSFSLLETEFEVLDHKADGPIKFAVVTPRWRLEYEFQFSLNEPPRIHAIGEDGEVTTPQLTESLSGFLTRHGLVVMFEGELVLLEQGFLLQPDRDQHLYPVESVEVVDWSNINIRRESQGKDQNPESVQYRTIERLSEETEWELIIDDDGSGELADIVCMRRTDETLEVLLAHCKYSSKDAPGARVTDFYDVCGQAVKMNRAKSLPEHLTKRLLRREENRQADGFSGIVVGTYQLLAEIVREARVRRLKVTVAIVQPGLSKAKLSSSEDIRALLGATERFLLETHGMKLRVLSSQ